jgi:uncharacterized protein (TIGR03382 family)
LRADIAHSALSDDLVVQAASDQSEISNVLTPARYTGDPCNAYYCGGDADTDGGGGDSGPFFCDDGAVCAAPDAGIDDDAEDVGGGGCDTASSLSHETTFTWVVVLAYALAAVVRARRPRRRL